MAKTKVIRRPPSLKEQERRKAWGARWGRLVADAVAKRLKEGI